MLIACQQEEQKDEDNEILKKMEETHFVQVLIDVIVGE